MSIQSDIFDHAKACYPAECCGLVVIVKGRRSYKPCRNIATGLQFAIHPEDYADAEDSGVIDQVVHSHPDLSPLPSKADLTGCQQSGLEWLIVSYPSGETHEFKPNSEAQTH